MPHNERAGPPLLAALLYVLGTAAFLHATLNGPASRLSAALRILAAVLLLSTARITLGRPARFSAALSTSIGSLGVAFLVFITIMPVGYALFYGLLMLHTWIGWAFYLSYGAAAYLFLSCGTRMRAHLDAPPRDPPTRLPRGRHRITRALVCRDSSL